MDMNTTNINELPIDNNPPENRDLPEQQLNSSLSHMLDPVRVNEERHVRFQEVKPINKSSNFELKESHKVIILATILFLLFSDVKVKNYIMDILEVIFGKFLKTPNGTTTKTGLVFYSVVFSTILFLFISIIDLSSYRFAF
uniref:Uncharacterized protein n=1 Tax=viral metagenome TaxID=1070528 RepID=A0A6C0ETJ5_9ZZZZ